MSRWSLIAGMLAATTAVLFAGGDSAAGAEGTTAWRVVNDHCPVMSEEFASPQHEIEFHGSAVRFCCDECKGKFLSDPAAYVSHLPHLPAATVQAVIAQSQRQTRTEQANRWVERWSRPALLGLAVLVAVGLSARALFRTRRYDPPATG
jgi:YHS domain-containing protein